MAAYGLGSVVVALGKVTSIVDYEAQHESCQLLVAAQVDNMGDRENPEEC